VEVSRRNTKISPVHPEILQCDRVVSAIMLFVSRREARPRKSWNDIFVHIYTFKAFRRAKLWCGTQSALSGWRDETVLSNFNFLEFAVKVASRYSSIHWKLHGLSCHRVAQDDSFRLGQAISVIQLFFDNYM